MKALDKMTKKELIAKVTEMNTREGEGHNPKQLLARIDQLIEDNYKLDHEITGETSYKNENVVLLNYTKELEAKNEALEVLLRIYL